jgi:hypothetical protein
MMIAVGEEIRIEYADESQEDVVIIDVSEFRDHRKLYVEQQDCNCRWIVVEQRRGHLWYVREA